MPVRSGDGHALACVAVCWVGREQRKSIADAGVRCSFGRGVGEAGLARTPVPPRIVKSKPARFYTLCRGVGCCLEASQAFICTFYDVLLLFVQIKTSPPHPHVPISQSRRTKQAAFEAWGSGLLPGRGK